MMTKEKANEIYQNDKAKIAAIKKCIKKYEKEISGYGKIEAQFRGLLSSIIKSNYSK